MMSSYHQNKINTRIKELENLSNNYNARIKNIQKLINDFFINTSIDIKSIESDINTTFNEALNQKDKLKELENNKKGLNKYFVKIPAEKEVKLEKEQNIYKREKQRILNKREEFRNINKEEIVNIINILTSLKDKIANLEKQKIELEKEMKEMARKNLSQRRNILNQLQEEKETRQKLLTKKKDIDKKLKLIKLELETREQRLKELPAYKMKVNELFYKYKNDIEIVKSKINEINNKIDVLITDDTLSTELDTENSVEIDEEQSNNEEISNNVEDLDILLKERNDLEELIEIISGRPENDIYGLYGKLEEEKIDLQKWINIYKDEYKQISEYQATIQYQLDNPRSYDKENTQQLKNTKTKINNTKTTLMDCYNRKCELEKQLKELECININKLEELYKQELNAEKRWETMQTRLDEWVVDERKIVQSKLKDLEGELKKETDKLYIINELKQTKEQSLNKQLEELNIDISKFKQYKRDIKQLEQKIMNNNKEIKDLEKSL